MNDSQMDANLSTGKLAVLILKRFIPGVLFLCMLVFLPAGTLNYWNGWVFLGELMVPMLLVVPYFFMKDPLLLQKRMNIREKEKPQKRIVIINLVVFLVVFIISGLDFRFHWSHVPVWLVIVSAVFVFAGYLLFFLVMRQNSFASRVIEIQEKQQLIDTGLYGVIRHPMYLAVIIMYFFMPLVLGSYYSFVIMLIFPFLMDRRMRHEEEILEKGLEGYKGYMQRVKFRIIPYIW